MDGAEQTRVSRRRNCVCCGPSVNDRNVCIVLMTTKTTRLGFQRANKKVGAADELSDEQARKERCGVDRS